MSDQAVDYRSTWAEFRLDLPMVVGTYQIESTAVQKAVRDAGLPVLSIDTDYSSDDTGQLSTCVEAFLEMS